MNVSELGVWVNLAVVVAALMGQFAIQRANTTARKELFDDLKDRIIRIETRLFNGRELR